MAQEGSLRNVKQLMLEIHMTWQWGGKNGKKEASPQKYLYWYNVLRLLEEMGFRRHNWVMHKRRKYISAYTGKKRSCCYIFSYININFLHS